MRDYATEVLNLPPPTTVGNGLVADMGRIISSGLRRKAVTKCSKWAMRYRVMGKPLPGPWTFAYHPWLRDLHDTEVEELVAQKSAQSGFTELALNRTFFAIDVLQENVLYILPTKFPDAVDFTTSRFDPALEMSEHLHDLFTDVKNQGHKRAGNANLFVRSSRSRSQLKSVPAPNVIEDEVDEFEEENVSMIAERMSGQTRVFHFRLSTPTLPNIGINKSFIASTQDHFFFKCVGCNRFIEFIAPDSLVIACEDETDARIMDSYVKCTLCGHRYDQEEKRLALQEGIWVPSYKDRMVRGVYINQLYSCVPAAHPGKIAQKLIKARNDVLEEQELYNSKYGLPHVVPGAQVTDDNIKDVIGNYTSVNTVRASEFVTMGVDVGGQNYYEIDVWKLDRTTTPDINTSCICYVVKVGMTTEFEELDVLMRQFNVNFCVIDAQPETRKSAEFCRRNRNAKACYYSYNTKSREINESSKGDEFMSADRTMWLDVALGRFRSKRIVLPQDISADYKNHVKALVRTPMRDENGVQVVVYKQVARHDHYAHARNYSEIALRLGGAMSKPQSIASPL